MTGRPLLTPRQREVLALVAQGCDLTDIAARLVVTPKTVRNHYQQLRERLHARTIAHAVYLVYGAERTEIAA